MDPVGRHHLRRRLQRWGAAGLLVAMVAASERWDGPLTLAAIGSGVERVADAAATRLSSDAPPGSAGEIHLTFDDGPHLTYTPQVLEVLARHDARAVFFPIGNQVRAGAELLRRATAEGHRIGNHTWDHDTLRGIDQAGFDRTIGRNQEAVVAATGTTPQCLRPPGGAIDAAAASRASARGMSITMWTVDPSDWDTPGTSVIVDRVLAGASDGAVVLLHDGGGDRGQTVAALERVLEELSSRGYLFTVVPGC